MNRKPRVYGATPIRVMLSLTHEEWFYDITEAAAYVTENYTPGKELDARVQVGRYMEPVFVITKTGETYASPLYAQLLTTAPVKIEVTK